MTNEQIKSAIIAYAAYTEATVCEDERGQRVWGRRVVDLQEVFDTVGINTKAIVALTEIRTGYVGKGEAA